jgi:hypothetical protein
VVERSDRQTRRENSGKKNIKINRKTEQRQERQKNKYHANLRKIKRRQFLQFHNDFIDLIISYSKKNETTDKNKYRITKQTQRQIQDKPKYRDKTNSITEKKQTDRLTKQNPSTVTRQTRHA